MPPKRKRGGPPPEVVEAKNAKKAKKEEKEPSIRFTTLLRLELQRLNVIITDLLPLIISYMTQLRLHEIMTHPLIIIPDQVTSSFTVRLGGNNEIYIASEMFTSTKLDVFDYSNGNYLRSCKFRGLHPFLCDDERTVFLLGGWQTLEVTNPASPSGSHVIELPTPIVMSAEMVAMNQQAHVMYSFSRHERKEMQCFKFNEASSAIIQHRSTSLPIPFVPLCLSMDQKNQQLLIQGLLPEYGYSRNVFCIITFDATGMRVEKTCYISARRASSNREMNELCDKRYFSHVRLVANQIIAVSDPYGQSRPPTTAATLFCFEINHDNTGFQPDVLEKRLGLHVTKPLIEIDYARNELVMVYQNDMAARTPFISVYE